MNKIMFYIDVNNAYLSWTAVDLLNKGYKIDIRKIPSVISGDEEKRHGVILAKSPVAKELGIVSGEPLYTAIKKCNKLKVYKPNYYLYKKYSDSLYEMYKEYTNKVKRYSIDECILDMTDYIMPKEDPVDVANEIKERIKNTYGFTVNIGISTNRILSKMASDFKKPDKVHTLYQSEIEDKMWKLDIEKLNMVGKKTAEKLKYLGIRTIGDLANYDKYTISKKLGKVGTMLYDYANGIEEDESFEEEMPKSISSEVTLKEDTADVEKIMKVLLSLTEEVCYRLRKNNMYTLNVGIKIKRADFTIYSKQRNLRQETDSTNIIFEEVKDIFLSMYNKEKIRLISVKLSSLSTEKGMQISIFQDKKEVKNEKLDKKIDEIRKRFGTNTIKRARAIDIDKEKEKSYEISSTKSNKSKSNSEGRNNFRDK